MLCLIPNPSDVTKKQIANSSKRFHKILSRIEKKAISHKTSYFEKIDWPSVKNRAVQCIAVTAFNFKSNSPSVYISNIYTLNSSLSLEQKHQRIVL